MLQIISTYIGILLMMIGVILFGILVLNEKIKISNKKLFLIMFIVCIIHTLLYITLQGVLKTIIMCIINIFLYRYLFKISSQKSIFLTFLYMIILIIPDLLTLFFATVVLNVSKEFYYNIFAGSILGNCCTCLLFIGLTYVIRKPLNKILKTKIDNNTKVMLFSVLTFVCVGLFFYTLINEFRFTDNILLYLCAIIVLVSVLFSLIKQTIENNNLTKKYDNLLSFMTTFENEIEKQRILRHETKNEFLAIKAKICDKQKEQEIIDYIDDIVKEKIIVKQEEYAKFGYLPPNGIKGLCYFKVQQAMEKEINIALNISKQVKKSNIYNLNIKQQREFGKILGVFLDNAIEASYESKEKKIGIEAYITKEKEFKMIISNTYSNKVDKEKVGKESVSTKGKNRGHGLLLVKSITSNNQMFETLNEIQNSLYIQTIVIKNVN